MRRAGQAFEHCQGKVQSWQGFKGEEYVEELAVHVLVQLLNLMGVSVQCECVPNDLLDTVCHLPLLPTF